MINILICVSDTKRFDFYKNNIARLICNTEYNCFAFEHIMDLLDYINYVKPEQCVVFFESDSCTDGMHIASKVHEMLPRAKFNLISSKTEKIEELFFSGVTYFIEKPCGENSINRCIEYLLTQIDISDEKVLILKKKTGEQTINLNEIEYIMSEKRKIIIFKKDGQSDFYMKLDEIEEMLDASFLRCHQSFLVNMRYIDQFEEDGIILKSGSFVPVSRKKYYSSKRIYLSYITGDKEIISI